MDFLTLIIVTVLTALFSLAGGFLLLFGSKKSAKFVERFGTVFAAVVLLAVVFLDIVPEILEEEALSPLDLTVLILVGTVSCFLISFITGHFHKHGDEHTFHNKKQAVAMVIVDSLHTFVDGVVLGTSFLVSPTTGILTALATTAHEIPQEIGDFSIMMRAKLGRKKIIKIQILSGLILVPSAILAYFVGDFLEPYLPILLSLIAGFFLYIALGEIWSIISRIKSRKTNP